MNNTYSMPTGILPALFKKIMAVAFFALVLVSCAKEKEVEPQSNLRELTNIVVSKVDNPSFTTDGFVFKKNDNFYITLPAGSDLTKVKLSVTISPKASLTFNGMPLTGLSGIFDLSKTTKAIVTSE